MQICGKRKEPKIKLLLFANVKEIKKLYLTEVFRNAYLWAPLKTIIFLGDLYFMVTHSYLVIGLKPLMRAAFQ